MNKYIKRLYICVLILGSAMGLSAQITATLTQPEGCENNGMIDLQIVGDGPFTIDWTTIETDPDPGTGLTTGTIEVAHDEWNNLTKISELAPGQYCVTVKNAKCCEAKQCFELKKKGGSLKVAYKKNPNYCSEGGKYSIRDGEIDVAGFENKADWSFVWKREESPWETYANDSKIKNLGVGTYTLTATNKATGCEEILTIVLCCCSQQSMVDENGNVVPNDSAEPSKNVCVIYPFVNTLYVDHAATPPTGKGANNGSIKLIITGNSNQQNYYKWKEKKTGKEYYTQNISNLPPGEYCYTVTNGCQLKTDCIPIYVCEEKPMNLSFIHGKPCLSSKIDVKGFIEVKVNGGVLPYKIKWSSGQSTAKIPNLVPGTYSVTITDKGGCTVTGSFNLIYGKTKEIATDSPCQTSYLCDDVLVKVIPSKVYSAFDDPFDCRIENFYCPATDRNVGSVKRSYITFRSGSDCVLEGLCPNGSEWQVEENGFDDLVYSVINPGGCSNCYECIVQPVCKYPRNGFMVKNGPASGGNLQIIDYPSPSCPKGSCLWEYYCEGELDKTECKTCSGKPNEKIKKIEGYEIEKEYLGNIFQSLKQNKEIENYRFLIPEGANLNMTMSEFESVKNDKLRIVEKSEEFTEYMCNGQKCRFVSEGDAGEKLDNRADSTVLNKSIEISPNPFGNSISVSINLENPSEIQLDMYNSLGSTVIQSTSHANKGQNIINLKSQDLPTGMYLLKITNKNTKEIYNFKLIKD